MRWTRTHLIPDCSGDGWLLARTRARGPSRARRLRGAARRRVPTAS
jgi:hypothetical protein